MSTVVIVGGHGKVALLAAQALSGQGHAVRSTIRDEAQGADVEAAGAVPWTLDLEAADTGDVAEALRGADAVVFSAGAGGKGGPERTRAVDLEGARRTIAAAEQAGVRRFVMVSAIGVDEPLPDDTADGWRAYVESKREADATLRGSGLDYTIVRPGRLTDGPATNSVRIGRGIEGGEVPRADVAAVIAAVLADDSTIGAQFDLVSGDAAISDALAALQ
ncbi:SDR family oxidoreductase [Amnibacterium endophyticum]|uniref:SDR family oxidoreductase n=1 Tax=Amnibacterium endophyticum TaxID=2109337 RepID=A0ABW4LD81_9MICO